MRLFGVTIEEDLDKARRAIIISGVSLILLVIASIMITSILPYALFVGIHPEP